jgi:hypothetical protein
VVIGLVALVVAALVIVGLALVARQRNSDEVHSVEGYRSTLHTLEEVRTRTSSVRVLPRSGQTEPDGQAGVPPSGDAALEAPVVSGSIAGGHGSGDPGAPFETLNYPRESARHQRRAMASMNHGPRRIAGPIVVGVVVLMLVAGLVAVGARTHRTPSRHGTSTTGTPATHHSGQSAPSGTEHHGAKAHPTTTTAPASYTATTSSATGATYVPPAPSYVLRVTAATGPCWVEVTEHSSGAVVLAQTLPTGSAQSVHLSGSASLSLGAPGAVTVALDGTPVVMPTGYSTPFTMTFVPPAAGA